MYHKYTKRRKGVMLWLMLGLLFGGAASVSGEDRGFEGAWAWGNSFVISEHFVSLYYPHAMALLEAEQKMKNGTATEDAVRKLNELPGVLDIIVVSRQEGKSYGIQPESFEFGEFCQALLQDRLFKSYKSPMTKRILGGVCKFEYLSIDGKKYDTMVRPFQIDYKDMGSRVSITLILDRSWLRRQILSQMDSLSHENGHLLFWAASPTNDQYEQFIGITEGNDTLWWSGPKNSKSTHFQMMWPFVGIEIHSSIRKTE